MKKFKSLKLMLLGVLALGSMNAFAQEKATTVWRYTVSGNDATLIGFVADLSDAGKADVEIPNQVTDPANSSKKYDVKYINADAFSVSNDKGKLTKLTIKASKMTSFPAELLQGCTKLTTLDLSGATKLNTIYAKSFEKTAITAVDLSKTEVAVIENWFNTNYEYTADATNYKWDECNEANQAYCKNTLKMKNSEIPTVGGAVPGTETFGSWATAYAYNLTLPGAKQYGDKLPFTKKTANAWNKKNITGAVDEGISKKYTAEEAAAYNLTLENAMPYGFVLDAFNYTTFNSATGQSKVAGDKLTNDDVDAYNATLTGSKKAGDIMYEEDGVTPIYYTTEEAYAYNLALGLPNTAIEGNENPKAATDAEIDAWNLENVPGACGKGDKKPSGKKYTAGTGTGSAYDALLKLCGAKAKTVKDTHAGEKIAAKDNKTLKTLVLSSKWTTIKKGAFENCIALESVNFTGNNKVAQTINAAAFLGTKVAELDFSKTLVATIPADIVIDQVNVEENTTLTSVKLNTKITTIQPKTFMNCQNLATFAFASDEAYAAEKITKINVLIGSQAFAYTALAEFTLPAIVDETTANQVKAQAFEGCENLKKFTYVPEGLFPKALVNMMAFPGCIGVQFYTTNAYITNNLDAPKNSEYQLVSLGYQTEFTTKEFKDKPGEKYYIKYVSTANIRVDKNLGKVYNAYLEDGDNTLVIQSYKTVNGFYEIAAGATVLVITDNIDLQFEPGKVPAGSSWIPEGSNALKIVGKGGVSRAALDVLCGLTKVIYGWVSSATKGTGFMKITTGSTFPEGTMYALAAEPKEDGARLNVVWRDEFGNVEEEATAIKAIDAEAADNDAIFNLQGIQVKGAQKGVFIQNGKKYVK